jgi:hypothetical protein
MPGSRWTKPQIESLVDQVVQWGKPLPEIDIPGKTRAAVNDQRKRLQLAGLLNGSLAGREVRPLDLSRDQGAYRLHAGLRLLARHLSRK